MSLSDATDLIMKSVELFVKLPNSVPSSFNRMSAPLASKTISVFASNIIVPPAAAIVMSPDERAKVVPSRLKLSTSIPPSITAF